MIEQPTQDKLVFVMLHILGFLRCRHIETFRLSHCSLDFGPGISPNGFLLKYVISMNYYHNKHTRADAKAGINTTL